MSPRDTPALEGLPSASQADGQSAPLALSRPAYMIETQHKSIPWRWVVLISIVGQSFTLVLFASGSMTFTMRKFIDNPMIINSISSLDVLFNILVATPCLYFSDRIWTRFGRRLPFVLTAWVVLAGCLIAMPLAGGAIPLTVVIVLWLIFWDVASTFSSLQMEIIPPHQRGRAQAIATWTFGFIIMLQTIVISGRFDDVVHSGFFPIRGEQLIYWFGATCMFFCLLFVTLFVREQKPVLAVPLAPTNGIKDIFKNLFMQRLLWPVYLLAFSTVLIGTGLGPIGHLLFNDQWAYSKQDNGTNVFVGGVINLVIVIPLIGLIADRFDRMKLFAVGIGGGVLMQILYYLFIQFVLPDRRPTLTHMIMFGQVMSMFGQISGIAGGPLMFEYIPRDQMGTAQAGMNFVRSLTGLVTLNVVGLWVTFYSRMFCPPGTYDYLSGYIMMLTFNLAGCALLYYFWRLVKRGAIKPLGLTGFHPIEENVARSAGAS